MIFVIGEHVVLLVQFIFRLIVPAKPADISHIESRPQLPPRRCSAI